MSALYGETILADEAKAVAAITASIEKGVAAQARAQGVARRDAHPKMHGCVEASFAVLENLPAALRAGLFAAPKTYKALIRFSNGNGQPRADWIGDGRGMAIKLLDVPESTSGTQDFICINYPVFFVRNVADYVDFQLKGFPRFIAPSLLPPRIRLHELSIALAIVLQRAKNPLDIRYWSMTPYALGLQACKFSARPVGPPTKLENPFRPDTMRENMVRRLRQGPAEFDFLVQLCTDPARMPVEDPTILWPEELSPFIPVARITIPAQNFDTPAQRAFGEALSFTPWHAGPAHRPLGGINRGRKIIYETISALRHDINHDKQAEPTTLPILPEEKPTQEKPMGFEDWLKTEFFAQLGHAVDDSNFLSTEASKLVINSACASTRNRPHPWSTFSDVPTWRGLSDRTYLARHLPAAAIDLAKTLPDPTKVAELFKRPADGGLFSQKSTCLFPAFAQYLTDGFLRTNPTNWARTTSNHEIDMCPLYGRTPEQTDALRLKSEADGSRGRLKSQMITINGEPEEFPPFLYDQTGNFTDPAFRNLDPPLFNFNQLLFDPSNPANVPAAPPAAWPAGQAQSLFAVGGDRVNSSPFTAMMNTIWLREHNRVAGELENQSRAAGTGWTDERIFQTARNIIIPMFIKIVIEDYINHITPLPFDLKADSSVAWDASWNRPNWMTAEFSLLYRWHSLMPNEIQWPGGPIPLKEFTLDNRKLLAVGIDAAVTAAATQPTTEIGAFNTADSLIGVEYLSTLQSRFNHLQNYNEYRVAFGMARATDYGQISSDPTIQAKLRELYGDDPDDVEFYPGLFAEDRVADSPLPGLLMRMVAVDAFSQALTNPLLSEHVWKDNATLTFTDWGFAEIARTSKLRDVLQRQGRPATLPLPTMTQPEWRYRA
jgi:prostaglandin-endoperoxide synthase 2